MHVDQFEPEMREALQAFDKYVVCLEKAPVDCEKVVEKIASLNPPDSRGEPEKKLWRAMCGQMKAGEKTCTMAAKTMAEMQGCMKK